MKAAYTTLLVVIVVMFFYSTSCNPGIYLAVLSCQQGKKI